MNIIRTIWLLLRRTPGAGTEQMDELFPADEEIRPRFDALLTYLGYDQHTGFVRLDDGVPLPHSLHTLHQASSFGVSGAFCLSAGLARGGSRPVPVVYVAMAGDEEEADLIHRKVWAQNAVPLLVLARRNGVQIRNAFDQRRGGRLIPWEIIEQRKLNQDLQALQAVSLAAGSGWHDLVQRPGRRVDEQLLRSVRELSREVRRRHPQLSREYRLVNALIGRLLYLIILVDRGIIDQDWVDNERRGGGPAFPHIRLDRSHHDNAWWPADEAWLLLDRVDQLLNGSIFPITVAERAMISDDIINLILDVLERDELTGSHHQLGFAKISYAAIKTETISAMYELFLSLDDPEGKVAHGAFYTPPYLADYVLDEMDCLAPLSSKSVICDPACGSGVFLVGAYRRIVEREQLAGRPADLQRVLKDCIFGVERSTQAADVCRFSLCLTMLDYLPGIRLQDGASVPLPLFPDLQRNILRADFFEAQLPPALAGRATHVVANPPWNQVVPGTAASDYLHNPQVDAVISDERLSELFVWGIQHELLAKDGAMALLLSTKSFISPVATRSGSRSFPNEVARRLHLDGLINLSHFRYRLFRSARNPALIMLARNCEPGSQKVWVAAPLLSSQPLGADGRPWAIAIDRGDVLHVRIEELMEKGRPWFWSLMLRPIDRRYVRLISERIGESSQRLTLGAFLARNGMIMRVGESRVPLPRELVLGVNPKTPDFYRARLGLDGNPPTYELSETHLRYLQGKVGRIFSGNVLAITRNLKHIDYIEQPFAFNSSLLVMAFDANSELPRELQKQALKAIGAFLRSPLARYLYALSGRMWILDKRRFDPGDMEELPFPFLSLSGLIESGLATGQHVAEHELPRLFASVFKLDDLFEQAAIEYATFRRGYEDGSVPSDADCKPSHKERLLYQRCLLEQVRLRLGRATAPPLEQVVVGKESEIMISLDGNVRPERREPQRSTFWWSTNVHFEPEKGLISLIKPLTRSAWTIERAYADADRITQEILAA